MTETVIDTLLVLYLVLVILSELWIKQWRVNTFKKISTEFGLQYQEFNPAREAIKNADRKTCTIRQASGTIRGKNILLRDITLKMPTFRGIKTVLEINGAVVSLPWDTFTVLVLRPGISGQKAIAKILNSL